MRLFVAIDVDEPVRSALAALSNEVQARLASGPGRWRFVAPAAFHLTLQFLGEVDDDRIESLTNALASACHALPAFECGWAGLGGFPRFDKARVLYVSMTDGAEHATELARRVTDATSPLGFAADRRPFAPHLTLARLKRDARPVPVSSALSEVELPAIPSSVVREVTLFRSELRPTGPVYTPVARFPLAPAV